MTERAVAILYASVGSTTQTRSPTAGIRMSSDASVFSSVPFLRLDLGLVGGAFGGFPIASAASWALDLGKEDLLEINNEI